MRLIDADRALEHIKPYERSDEQWIVTGGTAIRLIHTAIDNAPTVDAVMVTRCKDCKSWRRNVGIADSPNGHCFERDDETNGQDYCSDGAAE